MSSFDWNPATLRMYSEHLKETVVEGQTGGDKYAIFVGFLSLAYNSFHDIGYCRSY
jgi:hypothetical protein